MNDQVNNEQADVLEIPEDLKRNKEDKQEEQKEAE
jgi:hypothetical protein